jgi:hypothetical protein
MEKRERKSYKNGKEAKKKKGLITMSGFFMIYFVHAMF